MQPLLKILFLPRWYPTSEGVQNGIFIQKHAKAAAINNQVVVLLAAPTSAESRVTKSSRGNFSEIILYYKNTRLPPLNFLLYLITILKGWRIVQQDGFRPEICHVNMLARSALLALWLNWKWKIPFIISDHWSGYVTGNFRELSILKQWFILYTAKKSSLITAVSEFHKHSMEKILNRKVSVLPNVAETLPDVWRLKPGEDCFRYLVVADLRDDVKNISGVIRAFAEVNKKISQTELVIVGDGKDRQKLEIISEKFPVIFMGEKSNEEVLKIIPTTHVMIVNSRIETFSVVTLEAIFSGRPVIVSRCGGPEQFVNGKNGLLIEKDNDSQLADAMMHIKNNYAQYPPEQVRQSIPNNLSMEKIAAVLDNYYDEALKASR